MHSTKASRILQSETLKLCCMRFSRSKGSEQPLLDARLYDAGMQKGPAAAVQTSKGTAAAVQTTHRIGVAAHTEKPAKISAKLHMAVQNHARLLLVNITVWKAAAAHHVKQPSRSLLHHLLHYPLPPPACLASLLHAPKLLLLLQYARCCLSQT
jgi:hypothetical protein